MATKTFTMHLYYGELYRDQGGFVLFSSANMADRWNAYVGPVTVEVEVPDNFDPRAAQVKALQEEERKVRAAFAAKITEIQARINELQAIEMVAA